MGWSTAAWWPTLIIWELLLLLPLLLITMLLRLLLLPLVLLLPLEKYYYKCYLEFYFYFYDYYYYNYYYSFFHYHCYCNHSSSKPLCVCVHHGLYPVHMRSNPVLQISRNKHYNGDQLKLLSCSSVPVEIYFAFALCRCQAHCKDLSLWHLKFNWFVRK